jgi:FlaA1/EpsC-like NDP-sugar epimerase
MGAVFQFGAVLFIRFSYRLVLLMRREKPVSGEKLKNVMIIGAGSAGQMILRDVNRSKELSDKVVCIIDDNANKWNRYIDGTPIVGGRDSILESVEKYKVDKIYIAMPSASVEDRREIFGICKETGCELKNLPGIYQLASGEVSVSNLKSVSIEDLLGRETIKVEMKEVFDFIHGKTVLVTGGGGSIGSELCRQVAAHNPQRLIIFDVYENNAYDIQLELKEKHPELDLVTLIGSFKADKSEITALTLLFECSSITRLNDSSSSFSTILSYNSRHSGSVIISVDKRDSLKFIMRLRLLKSRSCFFQ